jgi:hypothetical protein
VRNLSSGDSSHGAWHRSSSRVSSWAIRSPDGSVWPASPDDPGLPGEAGPERPGQLTGKVREVIFDCFGDFIGFTLESCSDHHHVSSHEKGVAEIVLRACREGCTVTVCLGEHGLRKIIVRC